MSQKNRQIYKCFECDFSSKSYWEIQDHIQAVHEQPESLAQDKSGEGICKTCGHYQKTHYGPDNSLCWGCDTRTCSPIQDNKTDGDINVTRKEKEINELIQFVVKNWGPGSNTTIRYVRDFISQIRKEAFQEGSAFKGKSNREWYQRGYEEARREVAKEMVQLITEVPGVVCKHSGNKSTVYFKELIERIGAKYLSKEGERK